MTTDNQSNHTAASVFISMILSQTVKAVSLLLLSSLTTNKLKPNDCLHTVSCSVLLRPWFEYCTERSQDTSKEQTHGLVCYFLLSIECDIRERSSLNSGLNLKRETRAYSAPVEFLTVYMSLYFLPLSQLPQTDRSLGSKGMLRCIRYSVLCVCVCVVRLWSGLMTIISPGRKEALRASLSFMCPKCQCLT